MQWSSLPLRQTLAAMRSADRQQLRKFAVQEVPRLDRDLRQLDSLQAYVEELMASVLQRLDSPVADATLLELLQRMDEPPSGSAVPPRAWNPSRSFPIPAAWMVFVFAMWEAHFTWNKDGLMLVGSGNAVQVGASGSGNNASGSGGGGGGSGVTDPVQHEHAAVGEGCARNGSRSDSAGAKERHADGASKDKDVGRGGRTVQLSCRQNLLATTALQLPAAQHALRNGGNGAAGAGAGGVDKGASSSSDSCDDSERSGGGGLTIRRQHKRGRGCAAAGDDEDLDDDGSGADDGSGQCGGTTPAAPLGHRGGGKQDVNAAGGQDPGSSRPREDRRDGARRQKAARSAPVPWNLESRLQEQLQQDISLDRQQPSGGVSEAALTGVGAALREEEAQYAAPVLQHLEGGTPSRYVLRTGSLPPLQPEPRRSTHTAGNKGDYREPEDDDPMPRSTGPDPKHTGRSGGRGPESRLQEQLQQDLSLDRQRPSGGGSEQEAALTGVGVALPTEDPLKVQRDAPGMLLGKGRSSTELTELERVNQGGSRDQGPDARPRASGKVDAAVASTSASAGPSCRRAVAGRTRSDLDPDYTYADKYGTYCSPDTKLELLPVAEDVGRGVFGQSGIKGGTMVTKYHGKVVSAQVFQQMQAAPFKDPRLFYSVDYKENGETFYILGYRDPHDGQGLGAFLNDPRGSGKRANCRFVHHEGVVYVNALRDIEAGEELTVDYGEKYWRDWAAAHGQEYVPEDQPQKSDDSRDADFEAPCSARRATAQSTPMRTRARMA